MSLQVQSKNISGTIHTGFFYIFVHPIYKEKLTNGQEITIVFSYVYSSVIQYSSNRGVYVHIKFQEIFHPIRLSNFQPPDF